MKGIKFKKNNEQYYPDTRYEVGDLYLTTRPENPSTRFGGTWELFGPGRTLVCVNTADTDFNIVKKTGGNKSLQSHTHSWSGTTSSAGSHKHGFANGQTAPTVWTGSGGFWVGTGTYTTLNFSEMSDAGAHTHTVSGTTGSTGSGNTQNLQPFITCYVWIRTA